MPFTIKPRPSENILILSITFSCFPESLIMPFFSTSAFMTSNWGLINARASPPGFKNSFTFGITFSRDINDTSITAMSNPSPISLNSRYLIFLSSITTTLLSFLNRQSRIPFPTSTAKTFPAPFFKRQSVKPPVDAPTSITVRPLTSMLK